MGILNATPDSFHAESRTDRERASEQAEKMQEDGAAIIDVGGMSTRPGADIVSAQEEIDRVIPIIQAVSQGAPKVVISCDTVHSATAEAAVEAGAGMINDIGAGRFDKKLLATVARLKVPYVLMHMPPGATPSTMQDYTKSYGDKVVTSVWDFLAERLITLRKMGINDVIVDPGFGFGKSLSQNYELLKNLHTFRHLGAPVMTGISRKGMIYKPLKSTPADVLPATTALQLYALQQGTAMLRVHDVKEAVQMVKLYRLLEEARLVGE